MKNTLDNLKGFLAFLHPLVLIGSIIYILMILYQMIPRTSVFKLHKLGFSYLGDDEYKLDLKDGFVILKMIGRENLDRIWFEKEDQVFKYRCHGVEVLDGIAFVLKNKADVTNLNPQLRDLMILKGNELKSSQEYMTENGHCIEIHP